VMWVYEADGAMRSETRRRNTSRLPIQAPPNWRIHESSRRGSIALHYPLWYRAVHSNASCVLVVEQRDASNAIGLGWMPWLFQRCRKIDHFSLTAAFFFGIL
jgi:hypothetical protein